MNQIGDVDKHWIMLLTKRGDKDLIMPLQWVHIYHVVIMYSVDSEAEAIQIALHNNLKLKFSNDIYWVAKDGNQHTKDLPKNIQNWINNLGLTER